MFTFMLWFQQHFLRFFLSAVAANPNLPLAESGLSTAPIPVIEVGNVNDKSI